MWFVFNKSPFRRYIVTIQLPVLILLATLASTTGCRSLTNDTLNGIRADKSELSAGISVSAPYSQRSRATRYFWGVTHTYEPGSTFKDLLSHILENCYQMQTVRMKDVEDLDRSLFSLFAEAKDQELDYLFAAEIHSWHQSYILFLQWVKIHFKLTCYDVQSGKSIWFSEFNTTNIYHTNREVLLNALQEGLAEVLDAR